MMFVLTCVTNTQKGKVRILFFKIVEGPSCHLKKERIIGTPF